MFQVIFGIRKSQNSPNIHSGEKPFTCKEWSKSFSEEKPFSSSLFTISKEKICCVSFKDSKSFNLFSSSSFLSLSSFLFKYVFKYVLIVEEIIGHDLTENIWKVVELSVSFSNSSCPTIVMTMLMIPSLVNIICDDFLS